MASCAACLDPILNSQRFLLDGTEVFHAECIGRSYISKLKLAEQRVRELEVQVADAQRSRVESDANRIRNEVTRRQASALVHNARIEALRSELDLELARSRSFQNELQGSRNQNIALREEIAQLKSHGEISSEPEKVEDDAVMRFRMLELD